MPGLSVVKFNRTEPTICVKVKRTGSAADTVLYAAPRASIVPVPFRPLHNSIVNRLVPVAAATAPAQVPEVQSNVRVTLWPARVATIVTDRAEGCACVDIETGVPPT